MSSNPRDCQQCGKPLLLIRPGRDLCARCKPIYRPSRGDLISTTDLAERWHVSEQRAYQITKKPSFPQPVKIEAPRTRLWSPRQVERWESEHRPR